MSQYKEGSLSLVGAVSMGTGVMIGAGIFALTGEIATFAGSWLLFAFIGAGLVAALTSYTYIRMSNAYPSAGGIGMILTKVYGASPVAAWGALLMFFSMIINQSLVARTFGNYIAKSEIFSVGASWIPWLGLGLVVVAFLVNILSNKYIEKFSLVMAIIKAVGLVVLAIGGLYVGGVDFSVSQEDSALSGGSGVLSFLGAIAIGVLAFKGFTTITNSGGELKNPHKNVGRAIGISLAICLGVYILVVLAVTSALSIDEILSAKNYSLAAAARPLYGEMGVWLTVGVAIIATTSGIIASMFAVSRMLAMLTDMKLVPHRHFGMPGSIQKHTLVYTAVLAALLTITFDVSAIAALGAIFYLIMDMLIHYGVLTRADRNEVHFKPWILVTAMAADAVIFVGLIYIKIASDLRLLGIAAVSIVVLYGYERYFLEKQPQKTAHQH